jgi:hypothetical protein
MRPLAAVELQQVLTCLSGVELLRVSRVSHAWYSAVDSPATWRCLQPRSDSDDQPECLNSDELLRADFFTSETCQPMEQPTRSPWSERCNATQ